VTDVHPEAQARMVDVTAKQVTHREALAECTVRMSPSTLSLVTQRALSKGDALEVARIAGIMAAKKTSELIPLCHPIALGAVDITFELGGDGIRIQALVKTAERTGVEMEAMTAATIAALTIYDMVKGTERGVEISTVRLLKKSGGRSGDWSWEPDATESDRSEPA
jgi:cyclic pyranopterin monophosphate synthase